MIYAHFGPFGRRLLEKPRIRKTGFGDWVCWSRSASQFGRTAEEAYIKWRTVYEMA